MSLQDIPVQKQNRRQRLIVRRCRTPSGAWQPVQKRGHCRRAYLPPMLQAVVMYESTNPIHICFSVLRLLWRYRIEALSGSSHRGAGCTASGMTGTGGVRVCSLVLSAGKMQNACDVPLDVDANRQMYMSSLTSTTRYDYKE